MLIVAERINASRNYIAQSSPTKNLDFSQVSAITRGLDSVILDPTD